MAGKATFTRTFQSSGGLAGGEQHAQSGGSELVEADLTALSSIVNSSGRTSSQLRPFRARKNGLSGRISFPASGGLAAEYRREPGRIKGFAMRGAPGQFGTIGRPPVRTNRAAPPA